MQAQSIKLSENNLRKILNFQEGGDYLEPSILATIFGVQIKTLVAWKDFPRPVQLVERGWRKYHRQEVSDWLKMKGVNVSKYTTLPEQEWYDIQELSEATKQTLAKIEQLVEWGVLNPLSKTSKTQLFTKDAIAIVNKYLAEQQAKEKARKAYEAGFSERVANLAGKLGREAVENRAEVEKQKQARIEASKKEQIEQLHKSLGYK